MEFKPERVHTATLCVCVCARARVCVRAYVCVSVCMRRGGGGGGGGGACVYLHWYVLRTAKHTCVPSCHFFALHQLRCPLSWGASQSRLAEVGRHRVIAAAHMPCSAGTNSSITRLARCLSTRVRVSWQGG